MEKTMKWWSECTTNWREKWAQVRTERNKLREEMKVMQQKLTKLSKDYEITQRHNIQLKNEFEKFHLSLLKHYDQFGGDFSEFLENNLPNLTDFDSQPESQSMKKISELEDQVFKLKVFLNITTI